ncbi:MAG: hypothetical protein ACSHX0_06275 [Akkermansiaceae bacterium]
MMKLNVILNRFVLPAVAAAFVISQPLMADDHGDSKMTPLKKSMKEANTALKVLRSMDKDDWATGAESARTAAAAMLEGMAYLPALVNEMPGGKEKDVAIADYRRLMGVSYASICQLEVAYLEEDQALVDEAMTAIKNVKKEGHKKYED